MKLVTVTPFGGMSQEGGIISLLSIYLGQLGFDVTQFSCNGAFSSCDRDSSRTWQRRMQSCTDCMAEQQSLASWSGQKREVLSAYLSPQDIVATRRWMLGRTDQQVFHSRYEDFEVRELTPGTFSKRFGFMLPDETNKQHVEFLRKIALSSVRAGLASRSFLVKRRPDVAFVAGAEDFISRAFEVAANKSSIDLVRFRWESGSRYIKIFRPGNSSVYPCEILLDSVASLGPDMNSWPAEVLQMIDEILDFLGLSQFQLQLPIAQ